MTAYGKAQFETARGLFLVEVHSVNRKGLDIHTHLCKEWLHVDFEIRSWLKTVVTRGAITFRLSKETQHRELLQMPSLNDIKTVHATLMKYAQELGYDPRQAVPFSAIFPFLERDPSISILLDETIKRSLFQAIDQALLAFVQMKEREGAALAADLLPRLDKIRDGIEKIKTCVNKASQTFQKRLEQKLEQVRLSYPLDPERLMREVVLFADKIDTSEEITRLLSHLDQFELFLRGMEPHVGRELGFLSQEMSREVATIGAKSQDLETVQTILAIKLELEKIREQVANIE